MGKEVNRGNVEVTSSFLFKRGHQGIFSSDVYAPGDIEVAAGGKVTELVTEAEIQSTQGERGWSFMGARMVPSLGTEGRPSRWGSWALRRRNFYMFVSISQ